MAQWPETGPPPRRRAVAPAGMRKGGNRADNGFPIGGTLRRVIPVSAGAAGPQRRPRQGTQCEHCPVHRGHEVK